MSIFLEKVVKQNGIKIIEGKNSLSQIEGTIEKHLRLILDEQDKWDNFDSLYHVQDIMKSYFLPLVLKNRIETQDPKPYKPIKQG